MRHILLVAAWIAVGVPTVILLRPVLEAMHWSGAAVVMLAALALELYLLGLVVIRSQRIRSPRQEAAARCDRLLREIGDSGQRAGHPINLVVNWPSSQDPDFLHARELIASCVTPDGSAILRDQILLHEAELRQLRSKLEAD